MLTKEQAQEIAWRLAEATAKYDAFPLNPEPTRVRLDNHKHGQEILGGAPEFWSVIYRMEVPPRCQVHPDFVHIIVDAQTGNARFIPLK